MQIRRIAPAAQTPVDDLWRTKGWAPPARPVLGWMSRFSTLWIRIYNSGATELLAYVFQKETGQDIEDYGEKYLFSPLGMKHYWKRTYVGVVDTEGGLFLSASDLAKIGYLYLQAGVWEGRQIVSKDWVMESVKRSLNVDGNVDYGFLWWLQKRADSSEYVWMARGFGQQHLMVFPQEKLIAVFTGWRILGNEADSSEWRCLFKAALLEADSRLIEKRICDAEQAIVTRSIEIFRQTGMDAAIERDVLNDAM